MRPIQTAPVKYDVLALRGGLDLVTPTLSLPPGVARDAQNMEVSITGGYARIQGYERFDGQPAPSTATWSAFTVDSAFTVAVGDTIRNVAGTAYGEVISVDGVLVVYTPTTGAFAEGDVVYVDGGTVPASPVLLDTFTAADGTDPTTRDMDVHPTGAARWSVRSGGFFLPGVIKSNSWTYTPGASVFPDAYENYVGLEAQASAPIISGYPYAIFVHATMPSAAFSSLYVSLQSDVSVDPLTGNFLDVLIGGGGDFISFQQYVRLGASYLEEYQAFSIEGEHRYAFWCDGSSWAMLADGATVATGTGSIPLFTNLDGISVDTVGASSTTADRALHAVGVYQSLTLAQALALTSPGGGGGGIVTTLGTATSTLREQAAYAAAAADAYRSVIQPVPGSGPVRGVAVLDGTVYAWRNNTGNTALVLHKGTSSGWSAVPLGFELSYNTGTGAAIVEGNTITNAGGTATGVVSRVVMQSGTTWVGSSGRLILSSVTGTWAVTDQIRVGGTQRATAGTAATAITLAPDGRVQTVKGNVAGYFGATRLYGCDNVNRGFEFDGSVYVPIVTGMSVDAPTNVAVNRNRLWFSFGPSVQTSGVGTQYIWSPVFGANEIAMPEPVTALMPMPGAQGTSVLVIYTRSNTSVLYGNSAADWNLVNFDRGTGAEPYTAQVLVDGYVLDTRGVINMAATQNFGNFDSSSLTFPLRPFVQARRGLATAAVVQRSKSQYRVFYEDGWGLYLTVLNGKVIGTMPVVFPDVVRCITEGDTAVNAEKSYFGGDSGYVYQLDKGPDFDGVAIQASFTANFASQGNARVLKRYRRASLEVTGDGYAEFDFTYSLGYDSPDIDQPAPVTYSAPFSGAVWDNMTWDTFTWDGRTLAPSEVAVDGTGENIAVTVRCNSRLSEPFTVNTITLHYSPRRGIR